MNTYIYTFAAFVRIGQATSVYTMHVIGRSMTLARALATREAEESARHEADAMAAIYGERVTATVIVTPLQ